MTSAILEWIKLLKTKPNMIISDANIDYRILRIYIDGYINGVETYLNIGLTKKISKWFQKKVNQKASVYWTNHIAIYYYGENEENLKRILLDTMEEYFLSNPDWEKPD